VREESPRWPELLDILLGTAIPSTWGGREVLWPLWANEAMHRAHRMTHLTLRLERRMMQRGNHAAWSASSLVKATILADIFAELRISDDLEVLPCSKLLEETACGLLNLFNFPNRDFDARIVLNDIALPAYKRRALVLATCTLVMQAISHAMECGLQPVISINLSSERPEQCRLAITTVSVMRVDEDALETDDLVDGLAEILEVPNVRRSRRASRFVTEIDFPGPRQAAPTP